MNKVAVTIDGRLLKRLDRWVKGQRLGSRSRAVQDAIREKLDRAERSRLARECAKANPVSEQSLSEESLVAEAPWPEY